MRGDEIHKERNMAVAERLVALAQMHLREARGIAGEIKIPLRLIHELGAIENDLWKASATCAAQDIEEENGKS